jgi:hypothetical protein
MFDINTKVQWRTGGRGVFRILKGTVIAVVKAGTIPKTKAMQATMPHGDKPSNRDRYIVEVKDGVFCWANIKTCWKQGEKMPPAKHRFGVKSKPKGKAAKKVAKVKAKKVTKAKKLTKAEKVFITPVKGKEKIKPLDRNSVPTEKEAKAKKSGGDKPKTTWYGIVDGKVVSVRKVVCPAGYSKDKPTPQVTPEVAPQVATPAASPLPTA